MTIYEKLYSLFLCNLYLTIFDLCSSLRDCPPELDLIATNDSKPVSSKDCNIELKELAARRNIFYLRPQDSSDPVNLPCNLCDIDIGYSPRWYFIKRNSLPIVDYDFHFVYGSFLKLIQTGNLVSDSDTYCLTLKNGLQIKSFNPENVLGTYYCESDYNNITKYIWHHVDTFYAEDDPNHSRMVITINAKSESKIKSALNDIEDELKRKYPPLIHESNLVKIFFVLKNRPSAKGLCGQVKLKFLKRCFLQIPRNISESRPLTSAEYGNYLTILDAVGSLFEYKSMSEKRDGRKFSALKSKSINVADALGFFLIDFINDIVIPCHFTFLKHLQSIPKMGNPFGISNPYGLINVQIKCPEINPMDIINLAMAKDVGKLKMKILGEVEKSMRAVDKLYLHGTPDEKLVCGFSKRGADICNNKRLDVQWRKKRFVFSIQSIVKQRIYVEKDCQLLFTKIQLKDSGVYHCYRKSIDGKSWNFSPTTKFLVQVEPSKNPIPKLSEVLKYLTVLMLWTVFIFVLWVILSVINIRIKVNARRRADERKRFLMTQERRKTLGSVKFVKPINEDDKFSEFQYDKKAD